MKKDYIVSKSNKLIISKYDLTLQEQKVILTISSLIEPNDEDFKVYNFKINDFSKLIDSNAKSIYKDMDVITDGLLSKKLMMKEENGWVKFNWLSSARYMKKEGVIALRFAPELKPYLLGLKEHFTKYRLENILELKSKYSIRMYEVLKSLQYKNKAEIIELEDLREIIGATEKTYDKYADFKRGILLKSQNELSKKTDISFQFEEIKTGRKVTSVKFIVKPNVKKKTKDEVAAIVVSDEESKVNLEPNIIELTEYMKDHNFLPMHVAQLYELANKDKLLLKEIFDYSKTRSKENLYGYMRNILKSGYVAPIKLKEIDDFNNYEQRQYNFEDLERKLLGWD